jgi:hypothetical protein
MATRSKRGVRVPRQTRDQMIEGLHIARSRKGSRLVQHDIIHRKFGLLPQTHYKREFGSLGAAILISEGHDAPSSEAPAPDKSRKRKPVGGRVTVRGGETSVLECDDVAEISKLTRMLGDSTFAAMLEAWSDCVVRLPEGSITYTFSGSLGDTVVEFTTT